VAQRTSKLEEIDGTPEHGEVSADYTDMIYAATSKEVETRRSLSTSCLIGRIGEAESDGP